MQNLFIAIEGIDGSGKSSQAKLLAERLEGAGHKVYATFEPTNEYIGSILRNILRGNQKADHRTIAGLFLADRLDHLLNDDYGLVKKLSEGYTVITDRYYFSSYAYHGTHMDMDWVIEANSMCARILKPHVNLFIDVAPETAMQRIAANRDNMELFETLESLKNVRTKYFEAFEKLKEEENILIVDGNGTFNEVADGIWNKLCPVLDIPSAKNTS
jgi:dTMP kinase